MPILFVIVLTILSTYVATYLLYMTYLYNFTDYLEERKVNDDSNKRI